METDPLTIRYWLESIFETVELVLMLAWMGFLLLVILAFAVVMGFLLFGHLG